MRRLRWINLLMLGLMAGSLVEPVYGSMRDGEVHHETLQSAVFHSTDALGDHGHEDSDVTVVRTHQHGPDHEHGTGSDHCTHQHGTLSLVDFGRPPLAVLAAEPMLASRSQVPPSASVRSSFRPPRS